MLIEEALDLKMRALARPPEDHEADELMDRHAELLALKERMG